MSERASDRVRDGGSGGQASERESFVMEGRRQAFLRIVAWLKLDWRDFEDLERDLFDHE